MTETIEQQANKLTSILFVEGCISIEKIEETHFMIESVLKERDRIAREEERERIKRLLRKEYEDMFHWGRGETHGSTYIKESEFEQIIKKIFTSLENKE